MMKVKMIEFEVLFDQTEIIGIKGIWILYRFGFGNVYDYSEWFQTCTILTVYAKMMEFQLLYHHVQVSRE